jgi:TetR/AcrR family transcriptional repressor of nem operon
MTRETHFQDTREHLLATGEAVIKSRGYAAVGLAEILAEARVPKGSFYHYFKSKEAFGADMLKRYFERYDADIQALLEREGGTGRERLLDYFQRWAARHEGNGCQQGCFATKLSGEVSDLSEPMRLALAEGMGMIARRLAAGVQAGQADGSLAAALDPEGTADALYSLWIGADLSAKVQRSAAPLHRALRQTEVMLAPT